MTSTDRSTTPLSPLAKRVFGTMALVALLAGCTASAQKPQNLDYSRTRASAAGVYRATIRPTGDSIPQGKLQSWTLHLETTSGAPVDSANVTMDGGMPQHGHGLPTKPQVTRSLGNGDHLVEGIKFNMGGWWVVKFFVSSSAGSDSLVFNLNL
jgi:YtkA-like